MGCCLVQIGNMLTKSLFSPIVVKLGFDPVWIVVPLDAFDGKAEVKVACGLRAPAC
jgi:hypothetical protein